MNTDHPTTTTTNAPALHNGTYTVQRPDGSHYTVKVWTALKGDLAGKRLISLLVGPNNVEDYKAVAFWNDDRRVANVWKRFASDVDKRACPLDGFHWSTELNVTEKRIACFVGLVLRDSSPWEEQGFRYLLEGRCLKCNRPLTTPESIETGIGPVCAGKA